MTLLNYRTNLFKISVLHKIMPIALRLDFDDFPLCQTDDPIRAELNLFDVVVDACAGKFYFFSDEWNCVLIVENPLLEEVMDDLFFVLPVQKVQL